MIAKTQTMPPPALPSLRPNRLAPQRLRESVPRSARPASPPTAWLPRRLLARLWRAARIWRWSPAVAKMLLWTGAFVALAHVGSGTVQRLLAAGTPTREMNQALGSFAAPQPSRTSQLATGSAAESAASKCRPPVSDAGPAKAVTDDGRIILNIAGERDLVQLPGIGTKRAQAITALRRRLGRFRRIRDLLGVRGIGPKLLRRLRPRVVLDPPRSDPPQDEEPPR